MPTNDLTGRTFGKLTVISKSSKISKNYQTYWNCLCSCGGSKTIRRDALLSESTQTCGCFAHGHRKNRTPEYRAWCKLKERCHNKNTEIYYNYGSRGITVCDRWNNSFLNFLNDMGNRPSPKHSMDRIDNNGNYEPSNCRWATRIEQANNKRTNHSITFNNKTLNINQWVRETGLTRSAIRYRLKAKWSVEKTLSTPVRKSGRWPSR